MIFVPENMAWLSHAMSSSMPQGAVVVTFKVEETLGCKNLLVVMKHGASWSIMDHGSMADDCYIGCSGAWQVFCSYFSNQ